MLIDNKQQRSDMSAYSQEFVRNHFSPEKINQDLRSIYARF
jgi:hypothetical protein